MQSRIKPGVRFAPARDFLAYWHYPKTSASISLRVPTTASSGSQAVDIKPHIIAEHTVMLDASIKAKAKETSWSWPTAQDGYSTEAEAKACRGLLTPEKPCAARVLQWRAWKHAQEEEPSPETAEAHSPMAALRTSFATRESPASGTDACAPAAEHSRQDKGAVIAPGQHIEVWGWAAEWSTAYYGPCDAQRHCFVRMQARRCGRLQDTTTARQHEHSRGPGGGGQAKKSRRRQGTATLMQVVRLPQARTHTHVPAAS